MKKRGFTVIELILVIAVIAILATLVFTSMNKMRAKSKLARVSSELSDIAKALTQYSEDNNYTYPADTNRGLPNGLEKYLAGGVWPTSVWPNGVFDWDNITTINGQPSPQIYQISYRLCGLNDPLSTCSDPVLFPNFVRDSSIFYCITGPCVPHQNDTGVPGYWVNRIPHEVNPPL